MLLAQHRYQEGWAVYQTALALDSHILQNAESLTVENGSTVVERGATNYYKAKGCVMAGMKGRAIEYLRMALDEGFTNVRKVKADEEFADLRGDPEIEKMLAEQEAR